MDIYCYWRCHSTDHWALLLRNTSALLGADRDTPLLVPAAMCEVSPGCASCLMTHSVLKPRPHLLLMSLHCCVATVLHCCCITTSHSCKNVTIQCLWNITDSPAWAKFCLRTVVAELLCISKKFLGGKHFFCQRHVYLLTLWFSEALVTRIVTRPYQFTRSPDMKVSILNWIELDWIYCHTSHRFLHLYFQTVEAFQYLFQTKEVRPGQATE